MQRTHAIPPPIREDRRSSTKGDGTGDTKIIALNLGKFKTAACVMEVATREHAFETIPISPAIVQDLITQHVTPDGAARSQRAAMTVE